MREYGSLKSILNYITANSDVEVVADNVVHVDFGAMAMESAAVRLAA